jgi:hypothetical protein
MLVLQTGGSRQESVCRHVERCLTPCFSLLFIVFGCNAMPKCLGAPHLMLGLSSRGGVADFRAMMSCGHVVKVGAARAIAGGLHLLGHSTACCLVSPLFLNLKDRGR